MINQRHSLEFTDIFGYKVFSSSLDDLDSDNGKYLINTFSPNSYGLTLRDRKFGNALANTDILVLDGMGIAVGSILMHGKNIKKIAGQDCFDHFMSIANQRSWKVFFMGSSERTLEKIKTNVNKDFPNVYVDAFSPPYKEEFSETDNKEIIEKINEFSPDILFVGLTAPKQEKWAYYNQQNLNVRIISTIGNVFDWYAGNSKRPSKLWVKLRMEWLARIFMRPEIFKRNTKNQMKFFKHVILHVLYIKRYKYN